MEISCHQFLIYQAYRTSRLHGLYVTGYQVVNIATSKVGISYQLTNCNFLDCSTQLLVSQIYTIPLVPLSPRRVRKKLKLSFVDMHVALPLPIHASLRILTTY